MITLYGISNCDTVKKTQKWLQQHNIEYTFHDFKKQGLSEALLSSFVEKSDWSVLLNKRSTTFRQLPDDIKNNLTDEVIYTAVLAQPTLLKRPLLNRSNATDANKLHVGFKADQYQELFINES